MALPQSFKAMVVSETADKKFVREVKQRKLEDLPAGELIIEVKYSSLNYKDALSASGNKGVTRKYPHTPGIDAAGTMVDCSNRSFTVGDPVIVTLTVADSEPVEVAAAREQGSALTSLPLVPVPARDTLLLLSALLDETATRPSSLALRRPCRGVSLFFFSAPCRLSCS